MTIKKASINSKIKLLKSRLSLYALSGTILLAGLALLGASFPPPPLQANSASLNLHQYENYYPPIVLTGIYNNASGLTYNTDTNTLFAIINNPEIIVEIDTEGNVLRDVSLEGFEDTEAITYIGNDDYVIVEERKRSIVIVNIIPSTKTIIRSQQRSLTLPRSKVNNKGFEGIASDPIRNRLYISNQKKPRELIQLDGFIENTLHVSMSFPWGLEEKSLGAEDISGLYFDGQLNNILLLSNESKQLVEANLQGEIISLLDLSDSNPNLAASIPQPEGITLGANNTLYILSEPNLLFKFEKETPTNNKQQRINNQTAQ